MRKRKKDLIIRSSKHSIKDANPGKRGEVSDLVVSFTDRVRKYVNIIWNDYEIEDIPTLLESEVCNKIRTDAESDSRLRQCAAKQASAIVRGTVEKHRRRIHVINDLRKKDEDTKKLQSITDTNVPSKPKITDIDLDLNSNHIDIVETPNGHFDMFVRISSIGDGNSIKIPINHTKVSRKWQKRGALVKSIRLNNDFIALTWEIPPVPKKTEGSIEGADQGIVTCLTISDDQVTGCDCHGHDLNSICERLNRRKKGSKNFKQTCQHQKNHINWSIKQLNFTKIKTLRLERLHQVRKGKKTHGKRQFWAYPDIKTALQRRGELEGFEVVEVPNKFRSQRCSVCGWVHKSNRNGKLFRCTNPICRFTADADLNASRSVKEVLCDTNMAWLHHLNREKGFFWTSTGLYDASKVLIAI